MQRTLYAIITVHGHNVHFAFLSKLITSEPLQCPGNCDQWWSGSDLLQVLWSSPCSSVLKTSTWLSIILKRLLLKSDNSITKYSETFKYLKTLGFWWFNLQSTELKKLRTFTRRLVPTPNPRSKTVPSSFTHNLVARVTHVLYKGLVWVGVRGDYVPVSGLI